MSIEPTSNTTTWVIGRGLAEPDQQANATKWERIKWIALGALATLGAVLLAGAAGTAAFFTFTVAPPLGIIVGVAIAALAGFAGYGAYLAFDSANRLQDVTDAVAREKMKEHIQALSFEEVLEHYAGSERIAKETEPGRAIVEFDLLENRIPADVEKEAFYQNFRNLIEGKKAVDRAYWDQEARIHASYEMQTAHINRATNDRQFAVDMGGLTGRLVAGRNHTAQAAVGAMHLGGTLANMATHVADTAPYRANRDNRLNDARLDYEKGLSILNTAFAQMTRV